VDWRHDPIVHPGIGSLMGEIIPAAAPPLRDIEPRPHRPIVASGSYTEGDTRNPRSAKGMIRMNVKDGLTEIRERLVENGASAKTLALVDGVLKRAALPAASSASANSLLQLTRMLMRSPVADGDAGVYDDLIQIEAGLEARAEAFRAQRAEEEGRPVPKTKKYYKELKDSAKKV
jgi:hypothetical protein